MSTFVSKSTKNRMNELGDGSTTLSFGSFLDMMAPKDGTDDREGRDEIDKIFSLFDVEGKGVITVRDITKVDNNVKFYNVFVRYPHDNALSIQTFYKLSRFAVN